MRAYLRVKIKSLAAEAQIIRAEERRNRGDVRSGLHQHRVVAVRLEARCALLAYAYVRGRSLASVEPKSYTQPDWKRVEALIRKYGSDGAVGLTQWRSTVEVTPIGSGVSLLRPVAA